MNWQQLHIFEAEYQSRPALIYQNETITYHELENHLNNITEILSDVGFPGSNRRIGIFMENRPGFVYSILAAIKLQASCVLLNKGFKQFELQDYLAETGTKLLLADKTTEEIIQALPQAKEITGLDLPADISLWAVNFPDTVAIPPAAVPVPEDQEFILLFTSGSSGKSRIVPRSYANVGDELVHFSKAIALTAEDRIVCPAPLYHSYAFNVALLPAIYKRATLVLNDTFFPNKFIQYVAEERPTLFAGVPFMYGLLNRTYLKEAPDFSSLRFCFSSGAKVTETLNNEFRERFGKSINTLYGSSEAGTVTVRTDDVQSGNADSVGKPIGGKHIRIVDEDDTPVSDGETGHLQIKSRATTSGYLNNPELNQQLFQNDWFLTGDIGRISEDGSLHLTGRKSTFINVAGSKVDPGEVEQTLRAHPAIKECVVLGTPDDISGEIVTAFIESSTEITEDTIIEFCLENLADYKVPRRIIIQKALPRSATGKILKKYLLEEL